MSASSGVGSIVLGMSFFLGVPLAFGLGLDYYNSTRKTELSAIWVDQCVETQAGANGIVGAAYALGAGVEFQSGAVQYYEYSRLKKVACTPSKV